MTGRGGPRVLLIGGTSHAGKSTVAAACAVRLGWSALSTDRLARHPGRPWGHVPEHVRAHYAQHTVEELTDAQLAHYEQMWPIIESTIRDPDRVEADRVGAERAAADRIQADRAAADRIEAYRIGAERAEVGAAGLVLEGSGIWPDRVASLTGVVVEAVWLAAAPDELWARIHRESRFAERTDAEQRLIEKFAGRTVGYDRRMRSALHRLGRPWIDTTGAPDPAELAAAVCGPLTALPRCARSALR